jgi:hypothetical protein
MKVLALEMSCLRRMPGVTRGNRIRSEDIRKRIQLTETAVEVIKRRRLMWFGHASRMTGDRQALDCYITRKRSRGHPLNKWINNMQEDLNNIQLNMNDAINLARDRKRWRHRTSTSSSQKG